MPSYLSPGVYVEETSFRSTPIEGVSTSTAGFVGRAQKGPPGKPTLVTSYSQFRQRFGNAYKHPKAEAGEFLANAVQAFFDNGGQEAFVVRVLGPHNSAASGWLGGYNDGIGGQVSARDAGVAGNDLGLQIGTQTRPSVKLAPATVSRARPTLRAAYTVTLASPNPALTLGADTVKNLREGDLLNLADPSGRSVYLQIVGIQAGTVGAAYTSADSSVPELSTSQSPLGVWVRKADGSGAVYFNFDRADDPSISLDGEPASIHLPHRVAAILGVGDALTFYWGLHATGDSAQVTVTSVTLSDTIACNIPATVFDGSNAAGTDPYQNAVLALHYTADRLIVSTPGTLIPGDFVSVTDGSNYWAGANVLYADQWGAVLLGTYTGPESTATAPATAYRYATPPASYVGAGSKSFAWAYTASAGQPTGASGASEVLDKNGSAYLLNGWRYIEKLTVGISGTISTLQMSSVSSFYEGAIVQITSFPATELFVVSSIDTLNRVLYLKGAFSGATSTYWTGLGPSANAEPLPYILEPSSVYLVLPVDPVQRSASARVVELSIAVLENNTAVETFSGLTWNPDTSADSYQRYFVPRINDASKGSSFIGVAPFAGDFAPTSPGFSPSYSLQNQWQLQVGGANLIQLAGGSDGDGDPGSVDLIGYDDGPGKRTGIQALQDEANIDIVAVPGATDAAVQGALITHCELLRYRFAVLDGKQGVSDVSQLLAHRDAYDSEYAAYYAPWLHVFDSYGNTLTVPPSGATMGVYAQTDSTRGVHKAPANVVVRNILEPEIKFGKGEQDLLNPAGVNLIRTFTGNGTRVWGARTISSSADWKYINVRRLFIYLENSIDRGTQWVVFEPNNQHLWARIVQTITSFLTGVWKTGALMGTKPSEAFFVRCDETTMTQDDIDNGRLVCLIGVAPTNPAEFVIFRIGQWTATANS
jgi:phage tail sheath protein FI